MHIDITAFLANDDAYEYSASVAEMGDNAGRITWRNAMNAADPLRFLITDEAIQAMRDYAKGTGCWEQEEIDGWTDQECEALFLQFVAGDLREMFDDADLSELTEEQWTDAEEQQSEGKVGGNVFRGDNGKVYYYLGY